MDKSLSRRKFLKRAAAVSGAMAAWSAAPMYLPSRDSGAAVAAPQAADRASQPAEPEPLKPVGEGKGLHPGRVVWCRDPKVLEWKGPGDGHWWEGDRTRQAHIDAMMARVVGELTEQSTVAQAWARLFRHLNQARGKGDVAYKLGEKIVIKPNWVGLIFSEQRVDPKTYKWISRPDYMNTAPQMVIALIGQLVREASVKPADITVCDTLAYLVPEYYDILHKAFPAVCFEDHGGKFGCAKVQSSTAPLYWSSRPKGKLQDYIPTCFAEAQYVVNFAAFKAHSGSGVTLCAKNHYGSLVRTPPQKGYYDIHPNGFSTQTKIYRPLVDVMGHAHLGGKTVLYLIDGLFSGVHPKDPVPQRLRFAPFGEGWPSSLFAAQDPVAIDSVAFDFLRTAWAEARKGGVDDYLHEAALADNPPSGTFYDPHHAEPTARLTSLGVHEHWNNVNEKKYSRNLGIGQGIELIATDLGRA